MNLQETTNAALDFTRRLQAALALGEIDLCAEILEYRSQAMAAFELAHRSASDQQKLDCREIIQLLIETDRELQKTTSVDLNEIAKEFREKMVSNAPNPNQGYMSSPAQACVDRKA